MCNCDIVTIGYRLRSNSVKDKTVSFYYQVINCKKGCLLASAIRDSWGIVICNVNMSSSVKVMPNDLLLHPGRAGFIQKLLKE